MTPTPHLYLHPSLTRFSRATPRPTVSFPPLPPSLTVDAVHAQLRAIQAHLRTLNQRAMGVLIPIEYTDVRLLVFRDGTWFVAHGDASYDSRHGDWCGSSSVYRDDTDDDMLSTALSLIDQVEDEAAEEDESRNAESEP